MDYPLKIKEVLKGEANNEMVFTFNGVITQDLIVSLGETVKSELLLYSSPKLVNRVFAIFIEMVQNVMHYSDDIFSCDNNSYGKGQVVLLKNDDGYEIITTNRVDENQKIFLTEKCKMVNSMDSEQLKELYLKTRRQKTINSTKGAGLGFIDIARRSGLPLYTDFENINGIHHFFYFRVLVYDN